MLTISTKHVWLIVGKRTLIILILLLTSYAGLFAQGWQEAYTRSLTAYSSEDYINSIGEGQKALALAQSSKERLYTLKLLSAVCNEVGSYKRGVAFGKEELELCKKEAVPDSVYINSLNTYVNNTTGLEDYEGAIPYQRRLVGLSQGLYATDNLELNQYISDLGYSYLITNNFDSAIFYLQQANKYLMGIEGGAEDFLLNQLNIGQAYFHSGELITALRTLQGLQDILENNGLDSYQIYAEAMESLALVQYSIGKFTEAQNYYEMASNKYQALGFASDDLEALNQQLMLTYLKNEEVAKSDSLQSLLGNKIASQNLFINQLSLAYQKYANNHFSEAKAILHKLLIQLPKTVENEAILAEAIMLNSRLNLELFGNSLVDSINISLDIFTKLGNVEKEAEALLVRAKIYQVQRENDKAITSLTMAIKKAKPLAQDFRLKYSIALDLLIIYLQLDQLKEADEAYNGFIENKFITSEEYMSKLSYNYALLLQISGYSLEVLSTIEPLLAKAEYPILLSYQQLLAKIYLDLGQPKKSIVLYNEIDQYLGKTSDSEILIGENMAQLGRVSVVLGEFSTAETYYLKSIELLENKGNTPARIMAPAYNSYAIYLQTIGNYNKAKSYYAKARFFAQGDVNLQIDIIQNLATLSQHEGEYTDAIVLLNEALNGYKELYGDLHPYYATALQNLANAYIKNSDPQKAKNLLEQAIRIDKRNGLENNISYTNKLHNLAVVLQQTDNLTEAHTVFTTVLENRRSSLGENHPDYMYSLYNMAVLLQKMGNNTEAKNHFKKVIEQYDFQIKSFFPYLSEQEKSKYYAKIKEAFTAFQDFAVEYSEIDPSINADLYNFQLTHKAILLNSSKSIKNIIARSNDQELMAIYDQWAEMKTSLAKYYSMSQKELDLAEISIEQEVTNANVLEKKLSLKSQLFNDNLETQKKTWKEIQGKLQANEAAIEIIRIKKNIANDSIWYAVLLVKPGESLPKLVVLKNGNELESKLFKGYINSIKFKRKDGLSYGNYWQQISEELGSTERIFVSSDGIYNKINISTLYNSKAGQYVLDQTVVHNVTNTLELLKTAQPLEVGENFTLNLFGNPSFGEGGQEEYKISALPGTKIEVETIDSLARIENLNSIKLLGKGASEENIKKMDSPSILHIATHGFFLANKTVTDDMYSIESNPLMRSGLLLSGAAKSFRGDHINFNGSIDSEDGILTAYEAMNLNLSNTNLVILSACETGLGEVKNGEGVYGLQRALVIAGAKSVMISLWKVDDTSTKELMILFYQNILRGMDKFEALNLAQKKVKEKYALPYYWGAFVLSGI